jgi:hypothetical protein
LAHNASARTLASSLKRCLPFLFAIAWCTVLGTHCLVCTQCKCPEASIETQTLLAIVVFQGLVHGAWHTLLNLQTTQAPGGWHRDSNAACHLLANANTVLGTLCLVCTQCNRPEAGIETQTLLAILFVK